ncbi:sugar transporter [Pontibacillus halophilus JSM 076056 = DSM 19796]|uniref:Sugar transporter n=1 Tax=Pontibacillus halophilus JSM 076056 = DSM 19796 TaxID=1385510 RepID=A0A0A5GL72_9BACI|nr:sugar transporter [Pontibacillus halophilus JSM 076056 = DSM 19796]
MAQRTWLIGVTALLLITLVACSNKTGTGPNGETIIEMSGWGSSPEEQELLEGILEEFERQHPDIVVEFQTISDQYMDVLKTRLIGKQAADVFYMDAFEAPSMMEKGVLEPLNPYITKDFDLDDFEKPLLDAFVQEDTVYGLPKDFSPLALLYNEKAFQEAGLEGPPETWEELREYSKKLTVDEDGDGQPERYGLGISSELPRQFYKFKPYGATLVDEEGYADFASKEAIQALQPVVDQYVKDGTSALPSDVGSNSAIEMFGQERAAMVLEGNWALPFLSNNYEELQFDAAEVPAIEGERVTPAFTVAYVMNAQSEKKEAAWELISFLTGKEGMKQWTETGFALPTRKSVIEDLGYEDSQYRDAFVEGASYAQPWQAGSKLAIIMNNFNNQFSSALLGKQTLQEALEKAEKTANNEIKALE